MIKTNINNNNRPRYKDNYRSYNNSPSGGYPNEQGFDRPGEGRGDPRGDPRGGPGDPGRGQIDPRAGPDSRGGPQVTFSYCKAVSLDFDGTRFARQIILPGPSGHGTGHGRFWRHGQHGPRHGPGDVRRWDGARRDGRWHGSGHGRSRHGWPGRTTCSKSKCQQRFPLKNPCCRAGIPQS